MGRHKSLCSVPSRRYVREGELFEVGDKSARSRYYYLFNDIFVCASIPKHGKQSKVRHIFELEKTKLRAVSKSSVGRKKKLTLTSSTGVITELSADSFVISLEQGSTIHNFVAESEAETTKWFSSIQQLMDDIKERKAHIESVKQKFDSPSKIVLPQSRLSPADAENGIPIRKQRAASAPPEPPSSVPADEDQETEKKEVPSETSESETKPEPEGASEKKEVLTESSESENKPEPEGEAEKKEAPTESSPEGEAEKKETTAESSEPKDEAKQEPESEEKEGEKDSEKESEKEEAASSDKEEKNSNHEGEDKEDKEANPESESDSQ